MASLSFVTTLLPVLTSTSFLAIKSLETVTTFSFVLLSGEIIGVPVKFEAVLALLTAHSSLPNALSQKPLQSLASSPQPDKAATITESAESFKAEL
ncbi:MAG: hypothetical protein IPP76_08395 [Moraxellaceae bacterium]|nr:hypothetical protein [Moraxellaceae bacterium]